MGMSNDYFDELPWESAANPFSAPRTLPGGWDMSGLTTGGNPSSQPESPPGSLHPVGGNSGCPPGKFAEPRTIPASWDVSAFAPGR